jgi:hypothetical protein
VLSAALHTLSQASGVVVKLKVCCKVRRGRDR